jgi:hypothetical protein
MKKWGNFIRFSQAMAKADGIDACDFVLHEAQAALVGTPGRPGKICDPGTKTDESTHDFIVNALPKRKHVKDGLSPALFSNS